MTFGWLRGARTASNIAQRWTANFGVTFVTLAGLIIFAGATPAAAEDAEIAHRRLIERRTFSDAEIIEGFFKVTFGAEFHIAGGIDRIRKYEGPVLVYVDNRAEPNRSTQVVAVVADIRARIRHIDIAITSKRDDAQIIVSLVRDRDLALAIRALYGIDRARRIQRSLEPQCLSGFRKDENSRILHSDVLIVADAGEFVFYDCIYEELLQSLGPINDDTTVPWTMFNDDVQMGFFDLYDQYLLNILYDPRIRPGMTRAQVEALLPEVLPQVRDWVDGNNAKP
ncbi:MAG: hypothetical protein QOF91_2837 [Alphaproteobacteria bacterium]|nr:hypothetical protein [Alphaproteobacteria bacterium]MEA3027552.1 hypothetical protein [Alphaproteobacteria bacterium]